MALPDFVLIMGKVLIENNRIITTPPAEELMAFKADNHALVNKTFAAAFDSEDGHGDCWWNFKLMR